MIAAVTMEQSETYIKLMGLTEDDKKYKSGKSLRLDQIHEYQQFYCKLIKEKRALAEKEYKAWQEKDGMQPLTKALLWTSIISTITILYFFKKKEMYCFKKKQADLDADSHYTRFNDWTV